MRISREKINKLAHAVADNLATIENVEFLEDRNTIRVETRTILEKLLAEEARIDAAARQKIENQRRTILEGSQEWDILYRKYYNEEVKKLRDLAPNGRRPHSQVALGYKIRLPSDPNSFIVACAYVVASTRCHRFESDGWVLPAGHRTLPVHFVASVRQLRVPWFHQLKTRSFLPDSGASDSLVHHPSP